MKIHLLSLFIYALAAAGICSCTGSTSEVSADMVESWPEVSSTMKPWTRWWWMGNAVDRENITKRLEEFAEAGLGGVEITPIYGVKGYEDRFIQHLSPQWMDMLIHTLNEADRLNMGVDMVQGTGWPFGGPQTEPEFAAGKLYVKKYKLKKGEALKQPLTLDKNENPEMASLQYLLAFDTDGRKMELGSKVVDAQLEWTAVNDCELYAVFRGKTGQRVKRAAPGGEGLVLDHFSREALEDYLEPYEEALVPVQHKLRALFNDSYEVYGANYGHRVFEEFKQRRGYDLKDHLPVLFPFQGGKEASRILGDYRETLSDLVLEGFSYTWTQWAGERSFKTRYQAHGCPGNLLDIYATADIPECESFYGTQFNIPGIRWDTSDANKAQPDLIMLKFASSAAHISGKKLTSAETLTWLREHFKTALSQCKPEIEQIFLSGVNHVFFHGSTYSPDDAGWPGWKFYASVNFVPGSNLWKDAPALFDYVTRCQSMLQSGKSDNEILVYWPFFDVIEEEFDGNLLLQLGINNKDEWLVPSPFYQEVRNLIKRGYSVDFISDRYLKKAESKNGKIQVSGTEYKALVVPPCDRMPMESFVSLAELTKSGATVVFKGVPETVPGHHKHEERTGQLKEEISRVEKELILATEVAETLKKLGIFGENLKKTGLNFVRREVEGGKIYYLVNHTARAVDQFVPLNYEPKSVLIMDPLTGKTGLGALKSGTRSTEVYLQMEPGAALILRTFDRVVEGQKWEYYEVNGAPVELTGSWDLQFLSGGPSIPSPVRMEGLQSWTKLGDEAEAFSGTVRYRFQFTHPDPEVSDWLLDLGDVRESARVWINDQYQGCLWSLPFSRVTTSLKEGINTMDIEVTNLSANRIRDLEKRGIAWKKFYEINMVNRHYKPFDATIWDPMPSGLLGKITLSPLQKKTI